LSLKKKEYSEAAKQKIIALKTSGDAINIQDKTGITLLHLIALGFLDNVLLEHFSISDIINPQELMMCCVQYKNLDMTKWLLNKGISANIQDALGDSALAITSWENDVETATVLFEYNADVNLRDYRGNTALHVAVLRGNLPMIEFLLTKGADVNIQNIFSKSPLTEALSGNMIFSSLYANTTDEVKLNIISLLLENGAKVNTYEINKALTFHFQQEATKTQALLLMLGSSQDITIDLTSYSIRQFFTDENNIKALFDIDGYEEQKAIAKQNIIKSLQDYGQNHHDQKVLDIVQLFSEQEADIPSTKVVEDTTLIDQLDREVELSGDFVNDTTDAA